MKRTISEKDRLFDVWRLLRLTGDMVAQVRHKELIRYGISIRQAAVLHIITVLGEKATPAGIARAELRQPHTVSAILLSMEKQGLVRRQKDLARKNQVRAVLTEKGKKAYEESKRRESVRRIMACLSEEEQSQLVCMLNKIAGKAKQELRKVAGED